MRLRHKAGGAVTVRGLTASQKFELMFGVGPLAGDQSFASPDEYVQVWQRYRDSLLAECAPWRRPDSYWAVEVQYQPRCGSETEESVLLRLKLPLTPVERAIRDTRNLQAPTK
jgi:hypothetical protein